jgi:hypothetical protein
MPVAGVFQKASDGMPLTGEKCILSGIYKCATCSNTIPVLQGAKFPQCAMEGGKEVLWTLHSPD